MKVFRIMTVVCLLSALLFGCSADISTSTGNSTASRQTPAGISREGGVSSGSVPPLSSYGVFIGAGPEDIGQMFPYDIVAIDAAYFTAGEIGQLHQQGCTVYSYLNIGSIETFRDIYPEFQAMTLDRYDNWPDEFWIDVAHPEWQAYLVDTAAGALAEKGVDGFFLDNADVYYQYPTQEIFEGLVQIIQGLGQYGKDIVINGGDVFISRAMLEPSQPLCRITGVNQECVFTGIDFDNGALTNQEPDTSQYYQAYLEQCGEHGLTVYLTEYAAIDNLEMRETIRRYCEEKGYLYYIASSMQLDSMD